MSLADSYATFLYRFRFVIFIIWIGAIITGAFFVLTFLDHTVLEFVPPEGTAARTALDRKHKLFPNHTSDMAVVIYIDDEKIDRAVFQNSNDDNNSAPTIADIPSVLWFVNALDLKLAEAAAQVHTRVQVGNYYFLRAANATALANALLSVPRKNALVAPLLLECEFTSEPCRHFAQRAVDAVYGEALLTGVLRNATLNLDMLSSSSNNNNKKFPNISTVAQVEQLSRSLSAGVTGMPELVTSFVTQIKGDMLRMDVVVLPIALIIMSMTMKSLRLLIIPLASIGLTLLISFSTMYGVTFILPVSSAAPPLMMTLCIAMGIDYNLFILSRFSDEVRAASTSTSSSPKSIKEEEEDEYAGNAEDIAKQLEEEDANRTRKSIHVIANTLRTAGHTVLVSGLTLTVSFVALIFFPTNVLKSFGIACSVTIVVALCVCLNFTPTVLLIFRNFFQSGAIPVLLSAETSSKLIGGRCMMAFLRMFGFENEAEYNPAANRVVLRPKKKKSGSSKTTTATTAQQQHEEENKQKKTSKKRKTPSLSSTARMNQQDDADAGGVGARGSSVVSPKGNYNDESDDDAGWSPAAGKKSANNKTSKKKRATSSSSVASSSSPPSSSLPISRADSALYETSGDPQLTALEVAMARQQEEGNNIDDGQQQQQQQRQHQGGVGEEGGGRSMSPKGRTAAAMMMAVWKNSSQQNKKSYVNDHDLVVPDEYLHFGSENDDEEDEEDEEEDDDDDDNARAPADVEDAKQRAAERHKFAVAEGTTSAGAYGTISDTKLVVASASSLASSDDDYDYYDDDDESSRLLNKNNNRNSSTTRKSSTRSKNNNNNNERTTQQQHRRPNKGQELQRIFLFSEKAYRTSVFRHVELCLKLPWSIVLIVVLATLAGLCAWQTFDLQVEDATSAFLARGSRAATAYETLQKFFGAGAMMPYRLMLSIDKKTNQGNSSSSPRFVESVLDEEFVEFAHLVVTTVAQRTRTPLHLFRGPYVVDGALVNSSEIQACSNNDDVVDLDDTSRPQEEKNSYRRAINFFRSSSSVASQQCDADVLFMILDPEVVNRDRTAAMVLMTCPVDPTGSGGTHFYDTLLNAVRDALAIQHGRNQQQKNTKDLVLVDADVSVLGLPAETMDAMRVVYDHFPLIGALSCVAVMVMVAISFRSVVVPLRCILSIAFTEAFVFGTTVLVYQKGALESWGISNVAGRDSMVWLSPIVAFCVIVGVALDYDIFLLTRVVEIVEMEKRETAPATIRGLCSTGKVITSAGLVMGIAFFGLLMSSIQVLNELGFMLVVAVLFDTFVVRTFLVPSVMSLLGKYHWWPSKLEHPSIERKKQRALQRKRELEEEKEIAEEIVKNASFSYYAVDTGGGTARVPGVTLNIDGDGDGAGATEKKKRKRRHDDDDDDDHDDEVTKNQAEDSDEDSSLDKEEEFLANPYAGGGSTRSSSSVMTE